MIRITDSDHDDRPTPSPIELEKARGSRLLFALIIIPMLLAIWLGWESADAALLESNLKTSTSHAVRQGPTLIRYEASAATCEAEARARTVSPFVAPLRRVQLKSGMGVMLGLYPTTAECDAEARRYLFAQGQTVQSGANVRSCVTSVWWSTAFQPPTCVSTINYIATFTRHTTPPPPPPPPPTCPATPASRPGTCPPNTVGSWTQTATMGPPPDCVITWSSAPSGACVPIVIEPTGTATLTWQHNAPPPTRGFQVRHGVSASSLTTQVLVSGGASARTATLSGLPAGTRYFGVVALGMCTGVVGSPVDPYTCSPDSVLSNVVSKVVR